MYLTRLATAIPTMVACHQVIRGWLAAPDARNTKERLSPSPSMRTYIYIYAFVPKLVAAFWVSGVAAPWFKVWCCATAFPTRPSLSCGTAKEEGGGKGKPGGRALHGWLVPTSCKTRSARLLCVVVPSLIGWVRGTFSIMFLS